MKAYLLFLGIILGNQAQARDFREIRSCGNGGLKVQVDLDSPKSGQVVIYDYHAIDYLKSLGMIRDRGVDPRSAESRYPYVLVLDVSQAERMTDVNFKGATGSISSLYGRFYSIFPFGPYQRHNYAIRIYPESGGMKLRVDEVLNAFDGCDRQIQYNSEGSYCPGNRVSFKAEILENRADYFFSNCQ